MARTRMLPAERRRHLLEAAIRVFADEGIANSSVLRVTQEAGVSNGVFYYYFDDKDALVRAVGGLLVQRMAQPLIDYQQDLDPATNVSLGALWCAAEAYSDREFGSVMAEFFLRGDDQLVQVGSQLENDVRRGYEQGVFVLPPTRLTTESMLAQIGVGLRHILRGADPRDVGRAIAGAQLRMLGVPDQSAEVSVAAAQEHLERLRMPQAG